MKNIKILRGIIVNRTGTEGKHSTWKLMKHNLFQYELLQIELESAFPQKSLLTQSARIFRRTLVKFYILREKITRKEWAAIT